MTKYQIIPTSGHFKLAYISIFRIAVVVIPFCFSSTIDIHLAAVFVASMIIGLSRIPTSVAQWLSTCVVKSSILAPSAKVERLVLLHLIIYNINDKVHYCYIRQNRVRCRFTQLSMQTCLDN